MNGMPFRFCIATVGADRIRPKPDETELFVEWYALPVYAAPVGEALSLPLRRSRLGSLSEGAAERT